MSDNDGTVNHNERTVMLSRLDGTAVPQRPWAYDDFISVEEHSGDPGPTLVSLAFIRAAIRRGVRIWCGMGLAGLLLGFALYAALPHAFQASTSVLLTYGPYENAATASLDEQAIAESRTVAWLALRKLGLKQSASSFAGTYTAVPLSDRVLLITANASSSSDAVRRANAIAAAFLQFRASELQADQNLAVQSVTQQLSQARQNVNSISGQISQFPAQPVSAAQQARLAKLRIDLDQANTALTQLEQAAASAQAGTATIMAVKGSRVLDSGVPLVHSRLKHLLLYPLVGLILGIALGAGIVVVRALTSDGLLRRDDVAQALGAPVKISVGPVRLHRWLPGRTGLEAARGPDTRRIVSHLARMVPPSIQGAAGLVVVPVDDPRVAALSVVSLAVSRAQDGEHVLMADLCSGCPAASLLGTKLPGVHSVTVSGTELVVAVPDPDDAVHTGPFGRISQAGCSSFTEAVKAASTSADLLLTLAPLDPSLGGEHLGTWATATVAMVTAGKSSAARLRAVGEMIRSSGMTLDSVVLVGADKTDESLGLAPQPDVEYQQDRA